MESQGLVHWHLGRARVRRVCNRVKGIAPDVVVHQGVCFFYRGIIAKKDEVT